MHHLAKVMFGKAEMRPYHAECSCSTAGDFADHQEARNYLMMHLARIQGINSAEFVDETVQLLPVPAPAPEPEQAPPVEVPQPPTQEPEPETQEPPGKAEAAGE